MKSTIFKAFALVLAMSLTLATVPADARKTAETRSVKAVNLQQGLRDLWVEHIFWARAVVLSSKYGDQDAAKVAEANVVQNAKEIAGAIVPFYGKDAGDKLFSLLAGHYQAVKSYATAAFTNNKAGMEAARNEIMASGDKIAAFLSSANPNLPKDALESLLMTHAAHHMVQIDAIGQKDFSAEAENWVSMKGHMHTIADALAAGIAKQFPKKV